MTTTTRLSIAAAAIALATIGALPATAHADDSRQTFSTPSGNIRCVLSVENGSSPSVACQLENIDYAVQPGSAHDDNGGPCPSDSGSGRDVRLAQGQPGYVRCSYAALDGGVGPWTTLPYGQSRSLGTITCDSRPTALTCTDTSTGHYFRVSRLAYEVG